MKTLRRKWLRPSRIGTSPRSSPDVRAPLCPVRSSSMAIRDASASWLSFQGAIHGMDRKEQRIEQRFDGSTIQLNRTRPMQWIIDRGENRWEMAYLPADPWPPRTAPLMLHLWSRHVTRAEIERLWNTIFCDWKPPGGLFRHPHRFDMALPYELYFRMLSKAHRRTKAFATASDVARPQDETKGARGAVIQPMSRQQSTVDAKASTVQRPNRSTRHH